MKINPFMLAPPVIFLAFAVIAAVGMFRDDPNALPSTLEGRAAPSLAALEPFAEKPGFGAEELASPGVKLVNFWASWCPPCRAEHPNLEALAAEGIPIYGVNNKDRLGDAQSFLSELGNPYAGIGRDPENRIGLDWGVYGLPETFVIDGEGRVVLRFAGPVTQRALETTIRPAMDAASAR